MFVISPVDITDARLSSSSIAASTEAEWQPSTAYTAGDVVKLESLHKEYRCLINHTSGSASETPETEPVDGTGDPLWLDLGATNRWAMFDGKSQNKSTDTTDIVVELVMGVNVNGLALFGLEGDSVNVTMTNGLTEVYNQTVQLLDLSYLNGSYYNWFFLKGDKLQQLVKLDLPPYAGATITVTVAGTGAATRAIGELVVGVKRELGDTTYGTSYEIKDFSTKERDTFGNAIIVERAFSSLIKYNVMVPRQLVNSTKKFLSQNRTSGLVWIGDEDSPESIVYGFYNKWSIVTQNYSMTDAIIQVEELN